MHIVVGFYAGTLLPLTCDGLGQSKVSLVNAEGYRIDNSDITASSSHGDPNCHYLHARDLNNGNTAVAWCNGKDNTSYKFENSDIFFYIICKLITLLSC